MFLKIVFYIQILDSVLYIIEYLFIDFEQHSNAIKYQCKGSRWFHIVYVDLYWYLLRLKSMLTICAHVIKFVCHDYDMASADYGTVCHENLFKFTQTTSGYDVAIGATLITWHVPAVSRPSYSPRASLVSTTNILQSQTHLLLFYSIFN